jgi:hypothetical protein
MGLVSPHRPSSLSCDTRNLQVLTCRADPSEDGVVTRDIESALLGRDVTSDESHRDIDVKQHPALKTVHMVVSIDSAVIAAGLICKRQLLNESMLCQEMERAVDRAVGDPRVTPPHTLEDFSSGEMSFRRPDLVQDLGPLRRVLVSGSNHRSHQIVADLNENESY